MMIDYMFTLYPKKTKPTLHDEQIMWEGIFKSIGWNIGDRYQIDCPSRFTEEEVWKQIRDIGTIFSYVLSSTDLANYILGINKLIEAKANKNSENGEKPKSAKEGSTKLIRKNERICVLFSAPYISKRKKRHPIQEDSIDKALQTGWKGVENKYSLEKLQGAIVYLHGCLLDKNSDFHKIVPTGVYRYDENNKFYLAVLERAKTLGTEVDVFGQDLYEIPVDDKFLKKNYGDLSGNKAANRLYSEGYLGISPMRNNVDKEFLYVPLEAIPKETLIANILMESSEFSKMPYFP